MLLALASVLLLVALAMPLWRIQLIAPQYPEGLGMEIRARHRARRDGTRSPEHQLAQSLHRNEDDRAKEIAELRVMPWLHRRPCSCPVSVVAGVGRKLGHVGWLGGVHCRSESRASWDFYRWEYAYGHDLDFAHAIIKVPGMTYQPPLIGSKQLLNFTASSWPAIGSFPDWDRVRARCRVSFVIASRAIARSATAAAHTEAGPPGLKGVGHDDGESWILRHVGRRSWSARRRVPRPIAYGDDACAYCRRGGSATIDSAP